MSGTGRLARAGMWFLASTILTAGRRAIKSGSQSHLEVERKFHLFDDEQLRVPDALEARGFVATGRLTMTDTFLPAPKDGDMIRIRVESDGAITRRILTMKDWVVVAGEKERREKEREVSLPVSLLLRIAGRLLSGTRLLAFSKTRELYEKTFDSMSVVVSVDQVSGLGSHSGWYLELEVIVPLSGNVTEARDAIAKLVVELLGEERVFVKQSYQDMLREVSI